LRTGMFFCSVEVDELWEQELRTRRGREKKINLMNKLKQ